MCMNTTQTLETVIRQTLFGMPTRLLTLVMRISDSYPTITDRDVWAACWRMIGRGDLVQTPSDFGPENPTLELK